MMRFLIAYATSVAVVVCVPTSQYDELNDRMENMKFFLYQEQDGDIHIEDLVNAEVDLTSRASDVTYHYYSQKNPVTSVRIHSSDISTLRNTAFDPKYDTLFIIHGWKNSYISDVNSHIRKYILYDHNVNVFVVDWSPIAGKNYVSAHHSMNKVGGYIADFVMSLKRKYSLQLSKVKFVGHSLGAHVSGCAGAALNGQVDRIVGLDPAGPLFKVRNLTNRLDPSDAKFVQVIHTNEGMLGFDCEMGHADYYPNGGKSQPGCGVDPTGFCAHERAYAYYAESLISDNFVSRQCSKWSYYKNGRCANGDVSVMGMFNVDTRAKGTYYLSTRKSSPFAKGSSYV